MSDGRAFSGFGLHILNDTLIVPVQGELDDDSIKQLQSEILDKAQATSVTGVIIDMSAVRVLDSFVFSILAETAGMISLLGRKPVFVGFQAGVASALIDLEVNLDNISTALTMQDGLELLRSLVPGWKRTTQTESEESEAGNVEAEDDEVEDEVADSEPAPAEEDDEGEGENDRLL